MRVVFTNLIILVTVISTTINGQFLKMRENHRPQQLTNADVRYLAGLSDTKHIEEILDNILIPRVVGTPNHEKVFNYIKNELTKYNWTVEVDEFTENTPVFGKLTFKNIIGVLNPSAERHLVLACHYDSKYFKDEEFVGATDSAVPCAMMLNLIKVMKDELGTKKNDSDLGLKLMFFDGEEAFQEWGPTDSIYGARHLAKVYGDKQNRLRSTGETVTHLDRIDLLVLLDLIGAKDPNFSSFFTNTEGWYMRLAKAEDKLSSLGLLKGYASDGSKRYFNKLRSFGRIEDDHLPFLYKDVPILHIITTPFPKEWHTPQDDRSIVDITTVENLNKILRLFVAEYLHLSVNQK